MIYLVTYKESGYIEGYVKERKQFEEWLAKHNKSRKEDGELVEKKYEFELREIHNLLEVEG